MNFSDNDVNLKRYQCAQCKRTPTKAQELLQGCTCGHRLFRIVQQSDVIHPPVERSGRKNTFQNPEDNNFLTVQELEVGIYDINVEKLLSTKQENKKSSPLVVGNNGVFSIHLQHQKK